MKQKITRLETLASLQWTKCMEMYCAETNINLKNGTLYKYKYIRHLQCAPYNKNEDPFHSQ